ncbi:arsenate reductase (glutaredoxin) [Robbsia betulipollinis]|uniref:arsenate reductase (glutaredoxin) n=1 Tax=Robbsia betulipollinis TaxID=2981849 RepID=UPI0032C43954
MEVTIYHNPNCGNSRDTLALLLGAGISPRVVEYLETPPSRAVLADMIARAGLSVRDAIRQKEPRYMAGGLDDPALEDAALLDAMLRDPILINRPFVVTPLGVRLCRPPAIVHEILPLR